MTMTIGEVLDKLAKQNPKAEVYFDFCAFIPTEVFSWRGIYAEAAIGYRKEGPRVLVPQLIQAINKAIDGRTYGGWKGGEYRYSRDTPLHVDASGESTDTDIVDITGNDAYVVLHTKFSESY